MNQLQSCYCYCASSEFEHKNSIGGLIISGIYDACKLSWRELSVYKKMSSLETQFARCKLDTQRIIKEAVCFVDVTVSHICPLAGLCL